MTPTYGLVQQVYSIYKLVIPNARIVPPLNLTESGENVNQLKESHWFHKAK